MHASDEPVNERDSALASLIEQATAASRRCGILPPSDRMARRFQPFEERPARRWAQLLDAFRTHG